MSKFILRATGVFVFCYRHNRLMDEAGMTTEGWKYRIPTIIFIVFVVKLAYYLLPDRETDDR